MWRGKRNSEGWKEQKHPKQGKDEGEVKPVELETFKDIKVQLSTSSLCKESLPSNGPSMNLTPAAPRFKSDPKAILQLADGEKPQLQCVRRLTLTAYYGFSDALAGGFGATVEWPGGLYGQYGLWGKDDKAQSSNYHELRNLVDTVEEEANKGHLKGSELWLFTDNSTAESFFYGGGSLCGG